MKSASNSIFKKGVWQLRRDKKVPVWAPENKQKRSRNKGLLVLKGKDQNVCLVHVNRI